MSNDTIRRVSEDEGKAAQQWIGKSDRLVEVFTQAAGQPEFYTDGVTANTAQRWRDLRLDVMDKRKSGLPATPDDWADRALPAHVRPLISSGRRI